EQARALGEVGAGINIGPNASRILHRLGLAERLGKTGVKPATFDQRRWDDGRILLRSPLGEAIETAFGAPRIPGCGNRGWTAVRLRMSLPHLQDGTAKSARSSDALVPPVLRTKDSTDISHGCGGSRPYAECSSQQAIP